MTTRKKNILLSVLLGSAFGLGLCVAWISNAASYLSNAPETCINCHVMTDAYVSWQRGSHARSAVCNDCHIPHQNLLAKTAFKAFDGMKHSAVFTFRLEPQVLRLSNWASPVVQDNCLRGHQGLFQDISHAAAAARSCWDCHQNFHGSVQSLSASPQSLRPPLQNAGLDSFKQRLTHE